MKVLVGAFNKEKALEGTFSVIMKSSRMFIASSNYRGCEALNLIYWQNQLRTSPGTHYPSSRVYILLQLSDQRGHTGHRLPSGRGITQLATFGNNEHFVFILRYHCQVEFSFHKLASVQLLYLYIQSSSPGFHIHMLMLYGICDSLHISLINLQSTCHSQVRVHVSKFTSVKEII